MKTTVLGLGHLGAVAAAGLAMAGHDVTGVDIDNRRIEALRSGKPPFYEPGLEEWMKCGLQTNNLRFLCRDEVTESLGNVVLVTVGTPPMDNGAPDLSQVWSALDWLKTFDLQDVVIVMKSTVPPGTGRTISQQELDGTGARYVSNPEFLREGRAVEDWKSPHRIVIGVKPADGWSVQVVKQMHLGIEAPYMITDIASAEMIKYASNAFLATRISFINEMASVCEQVGASIDAVSKGLAMDARTGGIVRAGIGYGGSCFPKDIRALEHMALTGGVDLKLLKSVIDVNNRQRSLPLGTLHIRFGDTLSGLTIGVLGLAFKPDTDDVREAVSLEFIRALVDEGAAVRAFDPQANEKARSLLPSSVAFVDDATEACYGAHAAVVLTEWSDIVQTDWETIAAYMGPPKFLFDGRNVLEPEVMIRMGFEYSSVGRGRTGLPDLGAVCCLRCRARSSSWLFSPSQNSA